MSKKYERRIKDLKEHKEDKGKKGHKRTSSYISFKEKRREKK